MIVMRKIATSLYLEESMIHRADRIAIVSGMTRSEVLRLALETGMGTVEHNRRELLEEFRHVAVRFGMTPLELAARMTADEIHYRLVRDARTYPVETIIAA